MINCNDDNFAINKSALKPRDGVRSKAKVVRVRSVFWHIEILVGSTSSNVQNNTCNNGLFGTVSRLR